MPSTVSKTAICVLFLCAASLASAETYKWVDAQGQIHYSDRPPPDGAQKIELIPAQTYHAAAAAQAKSTAAPAGGKSPSKGEAVTYSVFEVRRPQTGDNVQNSGGSVSVELRLEPGLQPGHSIWLYLDGKRIDGLATNGTSFQLANVIRGEHTLVASITEPSGKPLVSTPGVRFSVQQNSIAKPPVGPALRPPPPPPPKKP